MVVWSLLAPGTSSLQTKKINWLIVLQNNNIKHSFLPLFSPICEQPEGRKVEDKIQMNHLNLTQPSGLSKQAPTVPINPPGSKMGESMWKQNQGLLQMEIAYFTQGNVWSIIYKLYADQLGLSQRSITLRKKYWYIKAQWLILSRFLNQQLNSKLNISVFWQEETFGKGPSISQQYRKCYRVIRWLWLCAGDVTRVQAYLHHLFIFAIGMPNDMEFM